MINILQKYFLLIAVLFLNFSAFAQENPPAPPPGVTVNGGPGTGTGNGDLEDDDVLPINEKLIWLAFCGIVFAFYTYNKTTKNEVSQ